MSKVISGLTLIGISGSSGTGKTTLAERLAETMTNTFISCFADPLKEAASILYGISEDCFYISELKETRNEFWGTTPREIAQYLGTEVFRHTVSPSFWVDRMERRLSLEGNHGNSHDALYEPGDTVIIPDVRFQNEVDFILAHNGIILHLIREGTKPVGIPGHSSEGFVPSSSTASDRIIDLNNNGTVAQLEALAVYWINLLAKPYIAPEERNEPID